MKKSYVRGQKTAAFRTRMNNGRFLRSPRFAGEAGFAQDFRKTLRRGRSAVFRSRKLRRASFLSGNEAIAEGAYESGVLFAAGYPGTPSSEILEHISKYEDVDAQWMANEKVALDAAIGASLAGVRSIVAMKHVGLNVASDTLMTLSYTGVNAGLVIVTADDPGMHSSQNEQDNRNYAKFAKIPLLEPADSQEAKDFVGLGLQISEEFDTPVLIKTTTRISHSKGIVKIRPRRKSFIFRESFTRNPAKYVMVPANARKRRIFVEERLGKLKRFSEKVWCNRIEWGKAGFGIVTSGVSYQYAKEACTDASFLKLGMSFPLPESLIKKFAKALSRLYVVEELDPFIEEQIRAMGIRIRGKELFPATGELNLDLVKEGLFNTPSKEKDSVFKRTPPVSPMLCAGCSYLGLFYVLRKLGVIVVGDIGCYTLSVAPPLSTMDTCISMGSSIGIALGLDRVSKARTMEKMVAVIGDSTFIHSGITPLISVVYHRGTHTVIILENKTTAMTGCQDHPGTGSTLKKERTSKIDYKNLVKALGIKRVEVIDGYDLEKTRKIIAREVSRKEPSVVIVENPCLLIDKKKYRRHVQIIASRCNNCRECLKIGCVAIKIEDNKKPAINLQICNGCSICKQVCTTDAIEEKVS